MSTGRGVDSADQLSLRDLLALPALGLRLVASPESVDDAIRWVHPTELLDPRPYLQGGELVLTVGSSLTGAQACRDFVTHLLDSGVPALGFGIGDVRRQIPTALVEACRAQGLALLEVPYGVPFQTIGELVAERRADARSARGRRLQILTGKVLEAVTEGSPVSELLALLEQHLGGTLTYADGELGWSPASDSDVPPGQETLKQLERVLAVRAHEEDLDRANRRREIGRLVELVLQGRADAEVLQAPLESAGLDLAAPVVPAAWPAGAGNLVQPLLGNGVVAELEDATLTFTADADLVHEVARGLSLPCGIGDGTALDRLATAVPPALAGLGLARERGGIVTSRDLTTFEGLLELQDPERLTPFTEQLVMPLVTHDEGHGSALLPTLRAFLDNDGSVTATAQEMFLHPNSLRHRLRRIEELTGANPRVFRDRVGLAIGVWSWERGLRRRR